MVVGTWFQICGSAEEMVVVVFLLPMVMILLLCVALYVIIFIWIQTIGCYVKMMFIFIRSFLQQNSFSDITADRLIIRNDVVGFMIFLKNSHNLCASSTSAGPDGVVLHDLQKPSIVLFRLKFRWSLWWTAELNRRSDDHRRLLLAVLRSVWCDHDWQHSHTSLKVLEFFWSVFKALKILENRVGVWKSLNRSF